MENELFNHEVIAETSPHVGKRMLAWFISFSSLVVCVGYYPKGSESAQVQFLLHEETYFLTGVKLLRMLSLKKGILACKSQSTH